LSNHHTQHNYYQAIVDNKEAIATNEFSVKPKLLTINIDVVSLEKNLIIDNSNIKSSIEKKSKDTLFIKTYIIVDGEIIISSSSVWTNKY
tara:strand:+ start:407 stop:676 length:270 start_codon:yes stop_codon:yes gene_type:complete